MKSLAIILVLAAGCCTHPDVSKELHQVRLIHQHYVKNTVPDPALPEAEQAKIRLEGAGLDAAMGRVEGLLDDAR